MNIEQIIKAKTDKFVKDLSKDVEQFIEAEMRSKIANKAVKTRIKNKKALDKKRQEVAKKAVRTRKKNRSQSKYCLKVF